MEGPARAPETHLETPAPRAAKGEDVSASNYWDECISIAAEECGLTLTPEQLKALSSAVEVSHENYGLAFYSPPSTDRLSEIQREGDTRLSRLQREFDAYRRNAESAVRQALNQRHDEQVCIGEDGEVFRHGGRTERIQ